ncbi:MAG: hypothetical protein V1647_03630 [Pseudomonadota bacterium]
MLFTVIFTSLFLDLYADSSCPLTETQYINGDYKKCAVSKEGAGSEQCGYIKALCNVGSNSLDDARYMFSMMSTADARTGTLSDFNALAIASLIDVAYIAGEYQKAYGLSGELNSLLSKMLPDSYPYVVSEVLLAKSYYGGKDTRSALKRLNMLTQTGIDPVLYCSINTL